MYICTFHKFPSRAKAQICNTIQAQRILRIIYKYLSSIRFALNLNTNIIEIKIQKNKNISDIPIIFSVKLQNNKWGNIYLNSGIDDNYLYINYNNSKIHIITYVSNIQYEKYSKYFARYPAKLKNNYLCTIF